MGVLVEEYLDGPEISVECATVRGRAISVAITRKQLGPPPYREETRHNPLLALAGPVAQEALHVVGFANGIAHVEMRLTGRGPRLSEVNGRLAGDLIPHLVREATGIDLPVAAADIALCLLPDLTPTRRRPLRLRPRRQSPHPRRRRPRPVPPALTGVPRVGTPHWRLRPPVTRRRPRHRSHRLPRRHRHHRRALPDALRRSHPHITID
ncbi:acetyl-CoA carboxylase biotin carboxylase subunit family protein [Kitasatospora sp. NE20-6]|uniref:ATP-grasp domain-containing protein n=1 Tax=Kitasatospora sp. NE20-6 TaxID=2859066 RepID=UPI0038B274CF